MKISTQDDMRRDALQSVGSEGLIVEVGCGIGNFAKLVQEEGWGDRYLGVDMDVKKIRMAMEFFPDLLFECLNLEHYIDAVDIILENAKTFCAFQTLEHIGTMGGGEDIGVLKRLKPGTKIILSLPDYKSKDHKRWMPKDDWVERYRRVIDIEGVKSYNLSKIKKFFMIVGVRNDS